MLLIQIKYVSAKNINNNNNKKKKKKKKKEKKQNENRCNSSFWRILPVGKKAVLKCRHRIYQILKEQFSNSNSFLLSFFEIHVISGHVD